MKNAFTKDLSKKFKAYCENNGIEGKEYADLVRSLSDDLCDTSSYKDIDCIKAPNAVIEAIDEETGYIFRRYLEIDFIETSNGIRLIGENMNGEASQIVFLSGNAIEKINEFRGQGSDTPHHKHD